MHIVCSRSLLGERGLKSNHNLLIFRAIQSLSAWRAWIEIDTRIHRPRGSRESRSLLGERGLKYQQYEQ